ncbi:SGNH/GDSL hydrolase family protein [bacterium]|nr:SGNH/GDSL hydrolase family protein [bacterium]
MPRLPRRTFVKSALVGSATLATAAANPDNAVPNTQGAAGSDVEGYDYRKPMLDDGITLLFQGDSITDMKWGRNQKDRNHYLGHSYVFLIASRLHADLPASKLNFLNRGMSGHTVGDLKKRWQNDALDLKPDVLSILVGINDVGRAVRSKSKVHIQQFETDYRSVLDQSLKANAKLKIVLLEPFVLKVGKLDAPWWDDYRSQTDNVRAVVNKLAAEYKTLLIKTQSIFDSAAEQSGASHWLWDGVHPLPQGHELIARNWIETVSTPGR